MARPLKIEIEPDEVVLVRFGTEFRYDYYRHAEKVLTPEFLDSLLEFDGNIVEFCLAAQ